MSKDGAAPELSVQMFELKMDTALKYGINIQSRTIQLVGEIDENMFILVETALTLLENDSKAKITIKINSPGGSVYDALAIVGRMEASTCKIVTEAYGAVMSAAGLVLAAGNKRRMSKRAWFMYHEASYEPGGTHSQIKHVTAQIEKEERAWINAMAEFTEAPAEYWAREGKAGKDLYLTAQECLTFGVIDEVF